MAATHVFQSYSRTDADAATEIAHDLQAAGFTVWRDERLSGGQEWWDAILTQIREADVIVFVLSEHSLDSIPCQRELEYANALGKAVLPVSIDSGVSPKSAPPLLASREWVDRTADERTAALRLVGAINAIPPAPALPDPLPTPPEVPLSYTTNLAAMVHSEDTLSPEEQQSLVFQLREGLNVEADRAECVMLLKKLSKRRDLLASVEREIERALASVDEAQRPVAPEPAPAPTHPDAPVPEPAPSGRKSVTKWIVAAVGVLVVAGLGVGGYRLLFEPSEVSALRDECESGDYAACDELHGVAASGSDQATFGATCGDRLPVPVDGNCAAIAAADDYGDNPVLDEWWDGCESGASQDCDMVYAVSAVNSGYESFGSTCGNRLPQGEGVAGDCTGIAAARAYGDHATLDRLQDECAGGSLAYCDWLYAVSASDSDYATFGSTCGDRTTPTAYQGACQDSLPFPYVRGDDAQLDELWDACASGDMVACDRLYWGSPSQTLYETFGSVCGDVDGAVRPGACATS